MNHSKRKGFAIIDVFLVIAIICSLIGLLIPAIQSARERSRRGQCINNLQTISSAILSHISTTQRFPTGGWGRRWVGDASRGNGRDQPGGWAYNTLPYMGHTSVHNMVDGSKDAMKKEGGRNMIGRLLPEFICPSRREAVLYPYHDFPYNSYKTKTNTTAHTDYAVNHGDSFVSREEGPKNYVDQKYKWPDTTGITGISFVRSMIQPKDITDGLGYTYLIGEKYLNPECYTNGKDKGDDGTLYQGDDPDIARSTDQQPMPDTEGWEEHQGFGSAHPTTWQASFCDGSVRNMSYEIDPDVHRRLGNRKDGKKVDSSEY